MAVGHVYSCKSSSPYYVTRFFWLHKIVQNHTKLLQKTDIHWSNFPKNCQSFPFGLVVSNICVFSTPTYLGKKIQFDKSIFQMGTQNDTAAQLGPMEWFGTQNKSSAAKDRTCFLLKSWMPRCERRVTIPETNSNFAPENGSFDRFLLGP